MVYHVKLQIQYMVSHVYTLTFMSAFWWSIELSETSLPMSAHISESLIKQHSVDPLASYPFSRSYIDVPHHGNKTVSAQVGKG